MRLEELILIALTMLLGIEGELWEYYETDPNWFAINLRYQLN